VGNAIGHNVDITGFVGLRELMERLTAVRFRTTGSPGALDETGDVPDLDPVQRSGRSSAGHRVSVPVILTLTTVVCKS
jgi:hypothetical protein